MIHCKNVCWKNVKKLLKSTYKASILIDPISLFNLFPPNVYICYRIVKILI